MQTYHIIQPRSDLGTHIFGTHFLSLWFVTTSDALIVKVPCELMGEQFWKWLVRCHRDQKLGR